LPGRSQSGFTFGYAATRGEDGLPGRSQRRRPEQSDTTTLGILVTLAHFSHSLRFAQAKPIIYGHALKNVVSKIE
jgi:hypothetical protein